MQRGLEVKNISHKFDKLMALRTISLDVYEGEVLGIVGESGSGKSTLARVIAGIIKPSSGEIQSIFKPLEIAFVFQDAAAALNPRLRVKDILSEAPLFHGEIKRAQCEEFLKKLLEKVGLNESFLNRYPHEFSGGQRARLGIARALALNPKLLIADEAVASLDVSIQAQILNLFLDLKQKENLTYLFISHDLSVIAHIADRIAVMYLGQIVEIGLSSDIIKHPKHPYTQALLSENHAIDGNKRQFKTIKGEIPSPLNPPTGCIFHPRCAYAQALCQARAPLLEKGVACHFPLFESL